MFSFSGIAGAVVDKVHIRAASNVAPTDLMASTMAHFLEILKAKAGDKVTYEYHPAV